MHRGEARIFRKTKVKMKLSFPTQAPGLDRVLALGLFLLVFGVYIATACRTIYTGDDGDFITAIVTGGVPHPTGYPLFCLLGRAFVGLIPFGEPAFRVNLMTAVFGAGAIAMLYRFLALLVNGRLWAVAGALIFAFAPTMWQQSLSCEVYSLNSLFLATLLYLSLVWAREPSNSGLLRVLTFVYGLSLTHHLTMALFLPGFLALVLWRRPALLGRDWPVLLSLVPLFLLPLLLYGYLPLMALRKQAPVLWGNPVTPALLWEHITGAQYRSLMFSGVSYFRTALARYATRFLPGEFGLWLLWVVPFGIAGLLRGHAKAGAPSQEAGENPTAATGAAPLLRAYGLLLLYIFLANVLYATNYNIMDVYVYFLPSYLVISCLIAAGASTVTEGIWHRFQVPTQERARLAALAAPVLLTLTVVHMSLHWAETDKSGNYIEADYASNILAAAPPNAIVFVRANTLFTLWYRQHVLGERPDVACISVDLFRGAFWSGRWYLNHSVARYPDLLKGLPDPVPDALMKNGQALLMVSRYALSQGRPVLMVPTTDAFLADSRENEKAEAPLGGGPETFEEWAHQDLEVVPFGVALRLYPKGEAPAAPQIVRESLPLWENLHKRGLFTGWAHNDPLQQPIIFRYAEAHVAFGKLAEEAGQYEVADRAYADALRLFIIPEAEEGRRRCARHLNPENRSGGS